MCYVEYAVLSTCDYLLSESGSQYVMFAGHMHIHRNKQTKNKQKKKLNILMHNVTADTHGNATEYYITMLRHFHSWVCYASLQQYKLRYPT